MATRNAKRSKICPECGGEFFPKPSHFDRRIYCSYPCRNIAYARRIGDLNPKWKGGRTTCNGYIVRRLPGQLGNPREHRVIMEAILGHQLRPDEIIHHKDEDIQNNAPENLEITSRADHLRLHGWNKKNGRARHYEKEQEAD